MRRLLTIAILCVLPTYLIAQSADHEDHDHVHHEHHQNEIGVANTLVYFPTHKEFSFGLHLHYIHHVKDIFGIGFGYERIFDEHQHNNLGIVFSYRPFYAFSINASPGITFEGGSNPGLLFAFHLETAYEFEIGNFHLGPVLEYAYDPEEYHLSFGIHLGFGF